MFEAQNTHLDSRSYLIYIISNILLSSPFKRDLSAYNANEDAYFILHLIDLVTTPTEKMIQWELVLVKFCNMFKG